MEVIGRGAVGCGTEKVPGMADKVLSSDMSDGVYCLLLYNKLFQSLAA